jgi:hypothetical protein
VVLGPGAVVLDGDDARALAVVRTAIETEWRRNGHRGRPGLLDDLARAAAVAVAAEPTRLAAAARDSSDPGTSEVPGFAADGSGDRRSGWLSTKEAANRLGVTERRVVEIATRLNGWQSSPKSAWWFREQPIADYAASRRRRSPAA